MSAPPLSVEESSRSEEVCYTSPFLDSEGEPVLLIWEVSGGAFLRLVYRDGTQFWIDRAGTNIWTVWPEKSSLEDTATYLLGPVLGILLRLKGEICLHASAVALGDRVAVFAGNAGAGKSTTAAAFVRQGYPIVSDDVVRLDEPVSGPPSLIEASLVAVREWRYSPTLLNGHRTQIQKEIKIVFRLPG